MPETEDDDGAAARFLEEGADWITFTSSSTAENFHQRFPLPELVLKFPKLGFASIGPETTKTLARLGVKADVEATPHTIEGLVKALERKLRK
jgi:uroporphyrinogen III methyltransferase/synthase